MYETSNSDTVLQLFDNTAKEGKHFYLILLNNQVLLFYAAPSGPRQNNVYRVHLLPKCGPSLSFSSHERERWIYLFYKINNQLSPEFTCTIYVLSFIICHNLLLVQQLPTGTNCQEFLIICQQWYNNSSGKHRMLLNLLF